MYNGVRLNEGKENDWYDVDGKIVIRNVRKIHSMDVIIIEFPDFSEMHLMPNELYTECSLCDVVIPGNLQHCGPCKEREVYTEIKSFLQQMDSIRKSIEKKKEVIEKIREEWEAYLATS